MEAVNSSDWSCCSEETPPRYQKTNGESKNYKIYIKQGNWETAWEDLKSVDPPEIYKKRYGDGKLRYEGVVGDRTITLAPGNLRFRKPAEITIYDNNNRGQPMRIVYQRNVKKED